ncbi:hypothetical protein LG293_17700 (plasmid) [Citricoccus nitrophenolicus]
MSQQHTSLKTEGIVPDRIITPGRALDTGTAMHEGMEQAAKDMAGTGFWAKGRRGNPHTEDLELAQAWDSGYETYEQVITERTEVSDNGQIIGGPLLG